MTESEIRNGVEALKWYHRIHLPSGVVTPGIRGVELWDKYQLPKRLDGARVLDVGAWDGAFSFEAEFRGADEVIALDLWDESSPGGKLDKSIDSFSFAKCALESKRVFPVNGDICNPPRWLGKFDVILFLQVLYHLKNPMLALENLRSMAKGLVCLETWLDAEWIPEPAAIFYPGDELNNDSSNWWGVNEACLDGMAKAAGFSTVTQLWADRDDTYFNGRGKRGCYHLKA